MAEQSSITNNIAALIASRRTIHKFKPGAPARNQLIQAIDAAKWAPNHYLSEPWHFYLLGSEAMTAVIELNTQIVKEEKGDDAAKAKEKRWRQIPGWLVISCAKSDNPVRYQEDYAACCCAAQNLMLYLWGEDIGMKWGTGTLIRDRRFYELMQIDPKRETIIGLFWYGYAAEIPKTRRKPSKQIVTELP